MSSISKVSFFPILVLWSEPTDWRHVGQFSSEMIWFLRSNGCSFLEFRTETSELAFRKRELLMFIPFVVLILSIFWGYMTIFSVQEYSSSGRYLSHGLLAIYYLGGIGFSRVLMLHYIINGR